MLLFLYGCVTQYNPATGRRETYLMDDKAEIKWGNDLADEFISKNKILKDDQMASYVTELGRTLVGCSYRKDLDYQFYIIDEEDINAFALPGGQVFIYRGLLKIVDKDELSFVLAHEIGHIDARHAVKRLGPSLGISLVSVLGVVLIDSPEYDKINNGAQQAINLITLGYSRQDEYQADSLGVETMIKAGFDPNGAIKVFNKFQEIEKDSGNKVPVYLRSHPFPEQRILKVKQRIEELTEKGVFD